MTKDSKVSMAERAVYLVGSGLAGRLDQQQWIPRTQCEASKYEVRESEEAEESKKKGKRGFEAG
jgi:hypothetical protein